VTIVSVSDPSAPRIIGATPLSASGGIVARPGVMYAGDDSLLAALPLQCETASGVPGEAGPQPATGPMTLRVLPNLTRGDVVFRFNGHPPWPAAHLTIFDVAGAR